MAWQHGNMATTKQRSQSVLWIGHRSLVLPRCLQASQPAGRRRVVRTDESTSRRQTPAQPANVAAARHPPLWFFLFVVAAKPCKRTAVPVLYRTKRYGTVPSWVRNPVHHICYCFFTWYSTRAHHDILQLVDDDDSSAENIDAKTPTSPPPTRCLEKKMPCKEYRGGHGHRIHEVRVCIAWHGMHGPQQSPIQHHLHQEREKKKTARRRA